MVASNEHGESEEGTGTCFKDKFSPIGVPTEISFVDEDGDKGKVGGTIAVQGPKDDDTIEDYIVHFGRTKTKRVSGDSFVKTIGARAKGETGRVSAFLDKGIGLTIIIHSENYFHKS